MTLKLRVKCVGMGEWRFEALECKVERARWWLCAASDYLSFAVWLPSQVALPAKQPL
jgi:hypothetical protein